MKVTPEDRAEIMTRLREIDPSATMEELTRTAVWLESGSMPIDSTRLENATLALADAMGKNPEHRETRAWLRGLAVAVLNAYHETDRS